jgi:hypothetical protein
MQRMQQQPQIHYQQQPQQQMCATPMHICPCSSSSRNSECSGS